MYTAHIVQMAVNNHWNGHLDTFFVLQIIFMVYNKICLPLHGLYGSFPTWPPGCLLYLFIFGYVNNICNKCNADYQNLQCRHRLVSYLVT